MLMKQIYSHHKCSTWRAAMEKSRGNNQRADQPQLWMSPRLLPTMRDAFISVPDSYRHLSQAAPRLLINSNLYANAGQPDI